MPWSSSRPKGSTRGYGTEHTKARAALLALHYDGAPCCLCGHPMYGPTRNLDADHLPGTDLYRGLAHGAARCQVCGKRCNRSDGGKRGRERQTVTARRM
jgi:hypothetical protein